MLKKILVPLDGSELAEKALPYAQALAQKFEAQLILVRILPPLIVTPNQDEQASLLAGIYRLGEVEADSYLTNIGIRLQKLNLNIQVERLEGSPVAEMILELAEDKGVDVIVMSTHGYSGNKRWIYGSVANKVLQHAPCPVFLVRPIGEGKEIDP